MKIAEFEFTDSNHFVAMEYYGLILNRTFLVLFTSNHLIGLKANGLLSASANDPLTDLIASKLANNGDLNNPYSYINSRYINRLSNEDLLGTKILDINKANFRIDYHDIADVRYNSRKKWGMGPYPHDGRVYIRTRTNVEKELIILGNQSGERIEHRILAARKI
jgi:hypothetical protein